LLMQRLNFYCAEPGNRKQIENRARKLSTQLPEKFERAGCRQLLHFCRDGLADAGNFFERFLVLQVRKTRPPRLDRAGGVCVSANLKWILTLQFEQGRDFFEGGGDLFLRHPYSSHPSAPPIKFV